MAKYLDPFFRPYHYLHWQLSRPYHFVTCTNVKAGSTTMNSHFQNMNFNLSSGVKGLLNLKSYFRHVEENKEVRKCV